MTVPPLKVQISAEDTGVNALLREVVANMRAMDAQAQRSGASVKSLGTTTGLLEGHTSGASRGFRKLETGLADLARQAIGADRATGQLAEGLLYLSGGGGILLGLAVGLAGIGLAYEVMTKQAREQEAANLALAESFTKQAKAATDARAPLAALRAQVGNEGDQLAIEQANLAELQQRKKLLDEITVGAAATAVLPGVDLVTGIAAAGAGAATLVTAHEITVELEKIKKLQDGIAGGNAATHALVEKIANLERDDATKALAEGLAIQQAGLARVGAANEAAYAKGAVGLDAYYRTRLAITRRGTADELATVDQQIRVARAKTSASPEEGIANRAAVRGLEAKRAELVQQRQTAEIQGVAQLTAAERARADAQLAFEARIATLAGQDHQAALANIAEEGDKLRLELAKDGSLSAASVTQRVTQFTDLATQRANAAAADLALQRQMAQLDADRAGIEQQVTDHTITQAEGAQRVHDLEAGRLGTLRAIAAALTTISVGNPALEAAARQRETQVGALGAAVAGGNASLPLARVTQQGDEQLNALARERAGIERDMATGKIGETQAEDAIAAAEQARLPTLQRIADAQLAFAEATKDPGLIEAARQLEDKVKGIAAAADQSGRDMAALRQNIKDNVEGAISSFLGNTIDQVHSLGEAFRDLAGSILQAIEEAVAAALAKKLVAAIGLAEGGYVSGPGTGTSDSIPARLSDGEFVVNARATAAYLPLLHHINDGAALPLPRFTGGVPRYAGGGLVTAAAGGGRHEVEIALSDGLIAQAIKRYNAGPDGEADHVNLQVRTTNRRRGLR